MHSSPLRQVLHDSYARSFGMKENIVHVNRAAVTAMAAKHKPAVTPFMLVPQMQVWTDTRGFLLPQHLIDLLIYEGGSRVVVNSFVRIVPVSATNLVSYAESLTVVGFRIVLTGVEQRRTDPLRAACAPEPDTEDEACVE